MLKRTILIAAAVSTLVGCGGQRVPEYGTVVDTKHEPEWIQVIPASRSCYNNSCTTIPAQFIHHRETWSMEIQDHNNPDWSGTVTDYTPDTFNKCGVGSVWPDCFRNW